MWDPNRARRANQSKTVEPQSCRTVGDSSQWPEMPMMSGDKMSPEPGRQFSAKPTPIRTYSRHGRALKRSFTSLSKPLSQSDNAITADVNGLHEKGPGSEPHGRLKRTLSSASSKMRPTDLFWEHLSAPAPLLIRQQEAHQAGKHVSAETDHTDPDIEYMTPDEEPPILRLDSKTSMEDATALEDTPDQQSRMTPSNLALPANAEQVEDECVAEDSDKYPLQRDLFDGTTFTSHLKLKVKRGSLLSNLSSSATRKTKSRRYQDVDETFSVIESSPASARRPLMPRKNLDIANDFHKPKGTRVPKKARAKHSVDGFDSPAVPWPIPTPTNRSKDVDFKEYKEMKAATNTQPKRSNDGFERNEARAGFPVKKRRVDGSDVNIGPLDTTQKGVTGQKMEGPTWQRGQKKSKPSTTPSLRKRRQFLGTSQFQIESEESPDELGNDHPRTTAQATRIRSKRRISHIIEDDELSADHLHINGEAGEQGEHNDSAFDDAEVARSSSNMEESAPYNGDADEPLDLLVFPFDVEDEADFTIRCTDTLETELAAAQLPPKRWVLNRQDDDQDALALRPNPGAWEREASVVPQTSDL